MGTILVQNPRLNIFQSDLQLFGNKSFLCMDRGRCKTQVKSRQMSLWAERLPFVLKRKRQQRNNRFTLKHKTINNTSLTHHPNPQHRNSSRTNHSTRKVQSFKIAIPQSPKVENTQSEHAHKAQNRTSFPVMKSYVPVSETANTHLPRCHNPENKCFCEVCDCGRHMCRLDKKVHGVFHGSTTYIKEYNQKQRKYDLKKEPEQGQTFPEKPIMYLNTTYSDAFETKQIQPRNQVIQNPEKTPFGGPLSTFTSYNTNFVRRVGDNQHVKFKDNVHMNGILPFHGKSVYNRTFKDLEPGIRLQPFKPSDNVKTGGFWLGKSTYQRCFQKHIDPEKTMNFAVEDKYETTPSYNKQFQTTYAKNYQSHKPHVCPAKVALHHSRVQMSFEDRMNLPCNTDFKDFQYASKHIETIPH